MAWYISAIVVTALKCLPPQKAWFPERDGKCIDLIGFLMGYEVGNMICDIAILCLPVRMIHLLQLSRTQKIYLSAIFLLGGLYVPCLPPPPFPSSLYGPPSMFSLVFFPLDGVSDPLLTSTPSVCITSILRITYTYGKNQRGRLPLISWCRNGQGMLTFLRDLDHCSFMVLYFGSIECHLCQLACPRTHCSSQRYASELVRLVYSPFHKPIWKPKLGFCHELSRSRKPWF